MGILLVRGSLSGLFLQYLLAVAYANLADQFTAMLIAS